MLRGDVHTAPGAADRRLREAATGSSPGEVFNEIAGAYDRHRPGYPEPLIDEACELAGLTPGVSVLEIGCGTGQLTRSLLRRGLQATALEPGDRLLARARSRLAGRGEVRFINARLEDVTLPRAQFAAVFAASAIHWVDPDVGWRTAADVLVDGGALVLVSRVGLRDARSAADDDALRAVMARVVPSVASDWPEYRDLDGTLAGVRARRSNVSEAWSWLTGRDLTRGWAQELFWPAQVVALPESLEHTGEELAALLSTMSFWALLSPARRRVLAGAVGELHRRLGRPIRSSTAACAGVARRRPRRRDARRGDLASERLRRT